MTQPRPYAAWETGRAYAALFDTAERYRVKIADLLAPTRRHQAARDEAAHAMLQAGVSQRDVARILRRHRWTVADMVRRHAQRVGT